MIAQLSPVVDIEVFFFFYDMIITCKINCYSGMVRELKNLVNQIFWLVEKYYIWMTSVQKTTM